jgi:Predicted membrane protein (DUF2254)
MPLASYRIRSHLRGSLWFVPVLCVGAGVLLSFATLWIDGRSNYDLVPRSFTGGPDAALAILGAIATSMVSLALEQSRLLDRAVADRVPDAERQLYLSGIRLGLGVGIRAGEPNGGAAPSQPTEAAPGTVRS